MGTFRLKRSELLARAQKIQLLLLDVDGILTDGRIVVDSNGAQLKAFYVRDGFGIVLARQAGLKIGFLTAEQSETVAFRARQLKIDWIAQGAMDKAKAFRECLSHFRLTADEVSFIGDDLLDLPVLLQVGLSATVPDAPDHVVKHVHYVTKKLGGKGAVRELIELILGSQGRWEAVVKRFVPTTGTSRGD